MANASVHGHVVIYRGFATGGLKGHFTSAYLTAITNPYSNGRLLMSLATVTPRSKHCPLFNGTIKSDAGTTAADISMIRIGTGEYSSLSYPPFNF